MNSWKAEEKPYFFKRNGLFFQIFFPRNNQTQEMLYSIFFSKVDDQPVAFAAVIHLMSEKRHWGTAFSNGLLMASNVQARGSH